MARRREFNVFSLSFLDIMSCGFGAVILIFIIIHHSTEVQSQELSMDKLAQVKKLQEQVTDGSERLVELKNTVARTDDEIVTTESMTFDVAKEIRELQSRIAALASSGADTTEHIESLKQELKRLQEEAADLEGSVEGDEKSGTALRSFVGKGDRQYLTGMNVGGEHILILLDDSASMLHRTIVNAVRMSYMSDQQKLKSEKWQRAVRTVEWIMANMPTDSSYQVYTFDTEAKPLDPDTRDKWLTSVDRKETDRTVALLKKVVPGGGTSLHKPFAVAREFNPRPDNIFLIVDGLPTQGAEPSKQTVIKSRERVRLFSSALDELPQDIPVNVILFPMEGDPMASPYFWILAQVTGGSFLSPSKDWP